MNRREHWEEADLILTGDSDPCSYGCPHSGCPHEMAMIARAHVHAVLALAASTGHTDGGEDQADDDTRRLDRIRVVLAKFDWEHDDRQLALETIERIAEGGQA